MRVVRRTVFIGSPLKQTDGLMCVHTAYTPSVQKPIGSERGDVKHTTCWKKWSSMFPSMRQIDSEHAQVLNQCFCVLTIRFGPIGQRSIGSILKQVLQFWSEGQKTDGPYTRSDNKLTVNICCRKFRPCVCGIRVCKRLETGVEVHLPAGQRP